MSSFLTTYLTRIADKHTLAGCADEAVLQDALRYFDADLDYADQEFADQIEDGAPTAREAMRAVVYGGPYEEEHAFQYRYAYRRLCGTDATVLDNRSFGPFRGLWLDEVDDGLRAYGVTAVSLSDFHYGSAFPAGLPYGPELSCGEWSSERCREALRQFERAEREGLAPELDREVAAAVQEVAGWLRTAGEFEEYGVIGFVS
ncbi:hypothetical protein [Streptomyces sp. CBMA123]|uniref:DUF7691 family protein n=1 Tax=Streptomyces sp. CBMA123 TaxID=1896313 RepID=UPI0016621081|nr:hypothetical protein [Streptomyces sp. CBMA123]MBD0689109.1 hypothetical protein [Streptomyces sp. CBMA123]